MENQHRQITGYRELDQDEINLMNVVKAMEAATMKFVEGLQMGTPLVADARWLAIAKTDIQKGFMALGRAIARPEGY